MTAPRTYRLELQVPGKIMQLLTAAADRELRTTGAQALWLIREGLEHQVPARKSREAVLRDAAELFSQLRIARSERGRPSIRAIARAATEAGCPVSHTAVHAVLAGQQAPSWRMIEAIAAGLETDTARFKAAWDRAWGDTA
jgi:hypothetical protein